MRDTSFSLSRRYWEIPTDKKEQNKTKTKQKERKKEMICIKWFVWTHSTEFLFSPFPIIVNFSFFFWMWVCVCVCVLKLINRWRCAPIGRRRNTWKCCREKRRWRRIIAGAPSSRYGRLRATSYSLPSDEISCGDRCMLTRHCFPDLIRLVDRNNSLSLSLSLSFDPKMKKRQDGIIVPKGNMKGGKKERKKRGGEIPNITIDNSCKRYKKK